MELRPPLQPLFWTGSSRKDLKSLPAEVQDEMGYALRDTQFGRPRINAKVLKGFGGAGVLEVVEDFDRSTYRAAYTVRFRGVVYVLHAFQKKTKHGIATPQTEMKLIRERLEAAEQHYLEWRAKHGEEATQDPSGQQRQRLRRSRPE